jgi:hypothetical protein
MKWRPFYYNSPLSGTMVLAAGFVRFVIDTCIEPKNVSVAAECLI